MAVSLAKLLTEHFGGTLLSCETAFNEVTIEVAKEQLREVCLALKQQAALQFTMLIDICAVDYQAYGFVEWDTQSVSTTGFSRANEVGAERSRVTDWQKPRFAVVYHVLSIALNQRLRVKVYSEGEPPMVDSVCDIWHSANWFEREAYDLFGVLFKGHPDLRRILTDYGFIGHPFRKDFPLIGNVAMRYDAKLQRVVYEPVDIEPRVLVPKVIRKDHRYRQQEEQ